MPFSIPLGNRLSNQRNIKGHLVALLQYDSTIMDGFKTPEGVNRDLSIDCIIRRFGLMQLQHNDPEYMRYYIKSWSDRNQLMWKQLYDTLTQEYNIIHNTDRFEEIDDISTHTKTVTNNDTAQHDREYESTQNLNETVTPNLTEENTVSADNVDSYAPDRKNTTTGNTSTSSDNNKNDTENLTIKSDREEKDDGANTYSHRAHVYGNIGVTTTQQMLAEQREIVQFTVENFIAESFRDEFCVGVW